MMRLFTTLLLCLSLSVVGAQPTNYNTIVMPQDSGVVLPFPEYLVQLAWANNPVGDIAQDEVLNARDALSNTRKEWMRDVQMTFNLNEANLQQRNAVALIKPDDYPQASRRLIDSVNQVLRNNNDLAGNTFFPRYNFGVTINLYNILSQKKKNQIGRRDVGIAEHRVNQRKLEIRAETLSRYAQWRLAKEILRKRKLVEQEARSNFVLIEQQYRTDDKTFEEYTTASSTYYQSQEAALRAETEVLMARFKLEEIIGLRWEELIHPEKEE
jgi:Outer membrane efflux protein